MFDVMPKNLQPVFLISAMFVSMIDFCQFMDVDKIV